MNKIFTSVLIILSTLLCYSTNSNGQAYFESNVSPRGNFSVASSWTLISGSDADSIPDLDDDIQILNGDTIDVDINAACHNLTIGQGGVSSLRLGKNSSINLTINGNLLINSNAILTLNNISKAHTIYLAGNLTNNFILDTYIDVFTYCNIECNGNTNQVLDGTGYIHEYYFLAINNSGPDSNNIVEIKPSSFTSYGTEIVHIQKGSCKIGGTFSFTGNFFRYSPFVPVGSMFWLDNPNVTILGSANGTDVYGLFKLTAGKYYCGINNTNNFYFKTGSKLLIEGGNLYIGSKFRGTDQNQSVDFEMKGGTMTVGYYGNLNQNFATFDINTSASKFTMSGGTIYIKNRNTNSIQPVDYRNLSGTVNVTGGKVQFGDPALPGIVSYVVAAGSTPSVLPSTQVVKCGNYTKLILNGHINVHGNFEVNSGNTLEQKGYTINMIGNNNGGVDPGNYAVSGLHLYDTSLVKFTNKFADQMIQQTSKFKRLTVDKDNFTLLTAISSDTLRVDSILNMVSGNIHCEFDPLILGKQTLTGLLNYKGGNIIGECIRWIYSPGTYLFPVGKLNNNGADTAAEMQTFVINNLTAGTIHAQFISSNPGENGLPLNENAKLIDHIFSEGYWKNSAGDNFNSNDFDLKLRAQNFSSYSFNADSRILKRNVNGIWSLNGTHENGQINPKEAKRKNLNQLGEFGIAHAIPFNCNYPDVPTIYTANNSICPGDYVELNIESGNLNDAADWYWYKDSCGGNFIGTGSIISDNPVTTTTYYVRGEGNCVQNGPCSSITITAEDLINPIITCPADMTIYVNGEICANSANYEAIAEDNCTLDVVIYSIPSGSSFIPGTYIISATAYDVAGNSSSCTFNLNVIDNENPILYCPSNIIKNNDPQMCGAVCEFTADAFDNCEVNDIQFFPASGSNFNIGQTLVTTIATDAYGNSSSCTFEVTIVDNEIPEILCPQNILQNVDPNQCSVIVNFGVTVNDNCGINTLQYSQNSGTAFNVGKTIVTATVIDIHGNTNSCSFEVNVLDNELPTVTCPSNIQVNNAIGQCNAIVNYTASATDNCGINSISYSQNSGTSFNVGQTIVTVTATDINNNSKTCSFEVNVLDIELPTVTCPSNIQVNNAPGQCNAIVNYTASATDNCGINSISYSQNSGTSFNVGQTIVTVTATDINNNSKTCSFEVNVLDIELPTVTCPSNIQVNNAPGTCNAIVNYTASATDNCGINSISYSQNSGTTFNVGQTIVTVTATDINNNTKTCSFEVNVLDIESPTVTCPNNQNRTIISPATEYEVQGSEFDWINKSDNCSISTTPFNLTGASSGSGSETLDNIIFNIGTTNVNWMVSDIAGNTTSCQFTVSIILSTQLEITCPGNKARNTDSLSCKYITAGTEFDPTSYSGGNQPSYILTGATSGTGQNSLNGVDLNKGITHIKWIISDNQGNTASCTFDVNVSDNIKPKIVCPTNKIVNTNLYCLHQINSSALNLISSTDNCMIDSIKYELSGATIGGGLNSLVGKTLSKGLTLVKWIVKDKSTNISTCSFNITVNDSVYPVVLTKNASIYLGNSGTASLTVNKINNGSYDNCSINSLSLSKNIFQCSNVGMNTVYLTATDAGGNVSSASAQVNVIDSIKPTAKCKNLTIFLQNGTKTISASQLDNNSKDNCSIQTYAISKSNFICADNGKNNVYLIVTDYSGNSSSCLSEVTVNYSPQCSIELKPSNNVYTGGIPNNVYLGYGPQSVQMKCNAVGGNGFTYAWSPTTFLQNPNSQNPSFVPTIPGNYTYTVTVTNNNGCTSSCSVDFCVVDIRVINSNPPKIYLCHNGQSQSVLVSNVPNHVPGHNNDYLGKCDEGCIPNSQIKQDKQVWKELIFTNELKELNQDIHYSIFPNPSTDEFIFESGNLKTKINIFNSYGEYIESIFTNQNNHISFGSEYSPGIYYAEWQNDFGRQKIKLIKIN